MSVISSSARYEGLLPFGPSDEPPPIRPTILENDPFPNGQPLFRKRASHGLFRFLPIFCVGVGTTLAWQSYGDAAREMIANSYPQLGWLTPRPLSTAQNAPGMIGLAAPAGPSFDQRQGNAMSLDAIQQSVDRISAGHDQIMRSIDQIATKITTDHEQMTRSTDQIANSIAAGQEQITRSIDQIVTSSAQAPSAKASGLMVESQANGASLQPTARLEIKPTQAGPPQTPSERGKQLAAASGHDGSCFPSASAVLERHEAAWPSWTLKAPGHEGTMCWYASARPRQRDHRSEIMPRREIVGTREKGPFAPPPLFAPRALAYARVPWLSAPPALFAPPALPYARLPWLSAPPALSHSRPPE
jgi:hypothetical protein